MKKIILILLISIQSSLLLFSQEKDSIDYKKQYVYCELGGVLIPITNKMEVWIDFGEPLTKKTKPVIFNSMIDALNSMAKQGWEFVNAYAYPANSHNVYCYVLRKEVTKNEN